MPIHALSIRNFKGILDEVVIPIKPITLFIGPNSSGKSSAIHALACLSQTVKLSNSSRPIILDDEFAQVRLGRFIEVIHTRSYADDFMLGIDVGTTHYPVFGSRETQEKNQHTAASYTFRSTKRTQEVSLDQAVYTIGDSVFTAKRATKAFYDVHNTRNKRRARFIRHTGLSIDMVFPTAIRDSDSFQEHFNTYSDVSWAQQKIAEELRQTRYLGPFRVAPLRRYPTRGANPVEAGAEGEAAITLLANEYVQSRKRQHLGQIGNWLDVMGLAKTINVSRVGTSDLFDVSVGLHDNVALPIADLGYGMSQVLPVLVQCSFAAPGSTLLFEQPELHLHSLAARSLAKVFTQTAKEKKAHIVAETHSPDLFYQVIQELRANRLNLDDVAAYEVKRDGGKSVIKEIEIDPETFDVYSRWERGLTCTV